MTEADTESIWDTALDTNRFGKIGVRIAELLNFAVNGNATSQVTSTAVTPIMEQLSEEILIELIATAKISAVTDPWDFIASNVVSVASRCLRKNQDIINDIQEVLNAGHHIKYVDIFSTNRSHEDYI